MAIEKLSDTTVKKLKPTSKDYLVGDGNGLYINIKANGTKLWTIRYKSPTHNKMRKSTIGTYPAVELTQARKIAMDYQKLISQGIDPIDKKREDKQQKIEDDKSLYINVVSEWIKKAKANVTDKTRKNAKSMLINDIVPYLEHTHIEDIKHRELVKAFEAKHKTAPVMADKMFRYCDELWRWSCTQDLCEYNILQNIDKKSILPPHQTLHHKTITELKELTRLIKSLYGLGSDYSKANILKLVINLPLRASNLTSLKWDYIDFTNRTLIIPRSEMKVKNPNLEDFTLPLTDEVLSILENQRASTLTKIYVFKSDRRPNAHIHESTVNNQLKKLGFDIRLHGFRSMYRSLANTHEREHGTSLQVRESILDHNSEDTTARSYTHKSDFLEEQRILLDWWSSFIIQLKNKDLTK